MHMGGGDHQATLWGATDGDTVFTQGRYKALAGPVHRQVRHRFRGQQQWFLLRPQIGNTPAGISPLEAQNRPPNDQ
jgi:hypothetical protein